MYNDLQKSLNNMMCTTYYYQLKQQQMSRSFHFNTITLKLKGTFDNFIKNYFVVTKPLELSKYPC